MSAERMSITMVIPKAEKHRSNAREVFRKSPLMPRQPKEREVFPEYEGENGMAGVCFDVFFCIRFVCLTLVISCLPGSV